MPVERLSHPSDGTSRKLCALSDFEFRVWCQYKLCANDYGVMADSPAPLMAENRVMERRGATAIRKALDRIIELELLLQFEHQGDRFLCSPVWQKYQRIRRPRTSHLPKPAGDVRERCSQETQQLFDVIPTAKPPQTSGESSGEFPKSDGNVSGSRARAIARADATADAVAQEQGESEGERVGPIAVVPPGGYELTPGQIRAGMPGLIGAWNNVAAVCPQLARVDQPPVDSAPLYAALRARPDIDWWGSVFQKVAASDLLRGLAPWRDGRQWPADFAWCLKNADAIAAGRYDNRERVSGKTITGNRAAAEAAKRILA